MKGLFSYTDYRAYVKDQLGHAGTRSGRKKSAADFLRVHTTYISQIVAGKAHLNLEQAELFNEFFQHSNDEGEYFLLLVMLERAGTKRLRDRWAEKIENLLTRRMQIKERIGAKQGISRENHEQFYSTYIYGAIHVLMSIPGFQNREAIAKALRIPQSQANEMIDFLLKIGILIEKGAKIIHGPNHIHLGNDMLALKKHHQNWRLHTIQNLDFAKKDGLHYSAAVSLSEKDAAQIKEIILSQLKENLSTIGKSKEEVAYVYAFDFYRL